MTNAMTCFSRASGLSNEPLLGDVSPMYSQYDVPVTQDCLYRLTGRRTCACLATAGVVIIKSLEKGKKK